MKNDMLYYSNKIICYIILEIKSTKNLQSYNKYMSRNEMSEFY